MSDATLQFSVQVKQSIPDAWFSVVEMIVYNDTNGGTWSVVAGKYILTLNGGHTSGALRFFDGTNYFVAVFGNQSGKAWTGTGTAPVNTALAVLPTFYGDGSRNNKQFWDFGGFSATDKEGRSLSIVVSPDAPTVSANLFIAPGAGA